MLIRRLRVNERKASKISHVFFLRILLFKWIAKCQTVTKTIIIKTGLLEIKILQPSGSCVCVCVCERDRDRDRDGHPAAFGWDQVLGSLFTAAPS